MRRTVLSAVALAFLAVPVATVSASAADATPSARPSAVTAPAPSAEPSRAPGGDTRTPRPVPSRPATRGQVSVVPNGAPDTGVASTSTGSGSQNALLGGAAAAVLAGGGAAVLLVRRRRATGA
ncbi:LPXTG cell wall anchor domain-containing protein [Streptomyces sp. NPDC059215]|uniref:LPXTG cell wall anchor domain-containing protein n=1 Tax=Streptomyces sp. NPDC059215 TaxID=3346772 RepID=UPI00367CEC0A